jgi:shikimate kinase
MGAGKSTVGRILAGRLGWQFLDADAVIESKAQASVAAIFATQGEAKFRQLEHETILELAATPYLVLALGGGAIEDERTLTALLLAENALLVHLEASLETVLDRCRGTEGIRPLLADRANLESRYQRRLPLYRRSHLTVPVDSRTPEALAGFIQNEIAGRVVPE